MKPLTPKDLQRLRTIIGAERYRITAKRPNGYTDGLKRYYARAWLEARLLAQRDVSRVVVPATRMMERRALTFRRKA